MILFKLTKRLNQWFLISEKGFIMGGPINKSSIFDAMDWGRAFASSWPTAMVEFNDPENTEKYERGTKRRN